MKLQIKQRFFSVLLVVFAVFSFGACSQNESEKGQTSLVDQGMSIIRLMEEMVKSESYGAMLTGNGEVTEIAKQIAAGSYEEPEAIYEITFSSMEDILAAYGEADSLSGLSENLKQHLNNRLQAAIMTQYNAQGGTSVLAATSVYTAGKTFVSQELTENKVYVYTFANGYPVAVTFVAGEDNSVSASGSFMMAQEGSASFEEIKELLETLFGESVVIKELEL